MKTAKALETTLREFKELLRMNDVAGDPWGVAMGAWFDCAAHLYEVGDCPREWQYRPGSLGNHIETDGPYYEFFNTLNADQLTEIGQFLWRLCEILKKAGRDY